MRLGLHALRWGCRGLKLGFRSKRLGLHEVLLGCRGMKWGIHDLKSGGQCMNIGRHVK